MRVLGGRQMLDPLDIRGPVDVVRILRPSDAEAQVRQPPRRLDQQLLERRLTVVAVGAEIAQVPPLRHVERGIALGSTEQ